MLEILFKGNKIKVIRAIFLLRMSVIYWGICLEAKP